MREGQYDLRGIYKPTVRSGQYKNKNEEEPHSYVFNV